MIPHLIVRRNVQKFTWISLLTNGQTASHCDGTRNISVHPAQKSAVLGTPSCPVPRAPLPERSGSVPSTQGSRTEVGGSCGTVHCRGQRLHPAHHDLPCTLTAHASALDVPGQRLASIRLPGRAPHSCPFTVSHAQPLTGRDVRCRSVPRKLPPCTVSTRAARTAGPCA